MSEFSPIQLCVNTREVKIKQISKKTAHGCVHPKTLEKRADSGHRAKSP